MKHVNIAGFELLFNWGTQKLMGTAVGKDPVNPLEGIEKTEDQAALILYGGLARIEQRAEKSISRNLDDCHKLLDDFTLGEITTLVNQYVNSLKVDVGDQSIPGTGNEEKKS